ncbi:phosphoglycerate kinase [Candidatus Shapirobacteria bacterium]|nr:phosphoglycerate kinase [Candidatus Shapirobacteria bacterium]
MPFPKLTDYSLANFSGRRVLVRMDYNVPLEEKEGKLVVADDSRIRFSMETLKFLLDAKARIILLSHFGDPGGRRKEEFSLAPVAQKLNELSFGLIGYKGKVKFCPRALGRQPQTAVRDLEKGEILVLENLRFYPGEEANDPVFAKRLAKLGDFYLNEAFSCSHRSHASIVELPKLLPAAAGFRFCQEEEILRRVRFSPQRPVVLVVGGVKEDKIEVAQKMASWVDKILVGGKLVKSSKFPPKAGLCPRLTPPKAGAPLADKVQSQEKIILGKLREDGQDLDKATIKQFEEEIKKAGTVIFAGPIGNTSEGFFEGTKALFEAALDSEAFVLAGGGDTEAALTKLGLTDRMDYISAGGGAMLAYLSEGTLVGIEALRR